jgi:hypothetical protein
LNKETTDQQTAQFQSALKYWEILSPGKLEVEIPSPDYLLAKWAYALDFRQVKNCMNNPQKLQIPIRTKVTTHQLRTLFELRKDLLVAEGENFLLTGYQLLEGLC